MASLRDQIVESYVAAFNAADGITSYRRDEVTSLVFDGILAVPNILGESKRLELELFYECTLRVGITIVVNREDADPTLDNSLEVRYLDRAVASIEKLVHTVELVQDARPVIVGSEYGKPLEANQIAAGLELSIQYAHDWDNPDTYSPNYA